MIILFLIGFILGIIYCIIAEKLPLLIPEIQEKEPNSWIFNLFISVINGVILLYSYINIGIGYDFFIMLIITALTIIIYISDFKYMIILDSPLVISGILILILKYFYFDIKTVGLGILSGFILFILMYLIGILGKKIFKKEALGGGDIKLAFIIGLILGLRLGLIAIIISSLLAFPYAIASILLNKHKEVPYGPFLVSSLVLVFLFLEKFTNLINILL